MNPNGQIHAYNLMVNLGLKGRCVTFTPMEEWELAENDLEAGLNMAISAPIPGLSLAYADNERIRAMYALGAMIALNGDEAILGDGEESA